MIANTISFSEYILLRNMLIKEGIIKFSKYLDRNKNIKIYLATYTIYKNYYIYRYYASKLTAAKHSKRIIESLHTKEKKPPN